jgi:hypothetical protein
VTITDEQRAEAEAPDDDRPGQKPEYLLCRQGVNGHQWKLVTKTPKLVDGIVELRSRCMHCGTVRTKRITEHGVTVRRPVYEYPEGYRGPGRTTQQYRAAFVRYLVDPI